MNCTSEELLFFKPCFLISCTAKGPRCEPEEQQERGREVSGVLVLGVLKWRSVLKQNSTAKAHHSPATPLRFRHKKNIKVYLLRMLDEVKRCKTRCEFFFFLPPRKQKIHGDVWVTSGAAFRREVLFANQTGELITVTY